MNDLAQRHAIDVQLLSIKCGAVYGALAFAGLILLGVSTQTYLVTLLAIAGAFFAYLNFMLISADAKAHWISGAMLLSIGCGAAAAIVAFNHLMVF
jgi:hypothetical protein